MQSTLPGLASFRCVRYGGLDRVAIAVCALHQAAVAMADALDDAGERLDVETPAGTHGHAPDVGASMLSQRHHGPDLVPCLEAEVALGARQKPSRKTKAIQPRALIASALCLSPA